MDKIKKTINKPKMAIFFYTLAMIFLVYTTYTGYTSYKSINELVVAGQITWMGSIVEVINYFIINSSAYLFYTLTFVFFGYACNFLNPKPRFKEVVEEQEIQEFEELVKEEILDSEDEVM